MIKKVSQFIFLFLTFNIFTQTNLSFIRNPEFDVKIGSSTLENPWDGGINYAQFSTIDLNLDGNLDLVYFDRSFNQLRTYLNQSIAGNDKYIYSTEFEALFPQDMRYRLFCADYNLDGKKDLFTYGIGGIKVYKNISSTSVLNFELAYSVLSTDYLGDDQTLYVSSSDIPAIVDVDGDTDLDILTFHIGGQRLEYHQNQSQELFGHSDSLKFVLKNECWGQFLEDPNTNNVTLNSTEVPCINGSIGTPLKNSEEQDRHSGSSVLALDMNNNGVLDLLLGDISHENVLLLMNSGSTPNMNSPMVSQELNFPSNSSPIQMNLFPATFFEDVDFDGIKDLIVTPNARNVSENQRSVWFYKNTGTNTTPVFVYQTNSFLQKEMIDHGTASIPVFFDQNGDGKRDLLLSHFFRYKPLLAKETTFQTYRNTGTASVPEFTFQSSDYNGFLAQFLGLRPVPSFGDLDNDGDEDMIIGRENGSVTFHQNTAGAGNPCVFANGVPLLNASSGQITSGAYAFPQLFDLNNDGKLDLIIGKKTGEIVYYKNEGTLSSYSFVLSNSTLGNVDISTNPDAYCAPHFFRKDNVTYLFVGGFDGKLHYYDSIEANIDLGESFHLNNPNFLGISTGAYSTFWVEDIDNDGKLNLFVGQDLGGISLYEVDPTSDLSFSEIPKLNYTLFPNPAKNSFSISGIELESSTYKMYSISGELQQAGTFSENSVNCEKLSSGMYFIHFEYKDKIQQAKIIITK